MKKLTFVLILILGSNMITGKEKEISISGIWLMGNALQMADFLKVKVSETVFDFCIEVTDDSKKAKIYFLGLSNFYEADIERIGINSYVLIYNKSKRKFVIDNSKKYDLEGRRTWYFTDISPFPPKRNRYRFDGTHFYDMVGPKGVFEYSIKGALENIRAESEMQSPD